MTKSEYNRIDHLNDTVIECFQPLDCGKIADGKELLMQVKLITGSLKRSGEKRHGETYKE